MEDYRVLHVAQWRRGRQSRGRKSLSSEINAGCKWSATILQFTSNKGPRRSLLIHATRRSQSSAKHTRWNRKRRLGLLAFRNRTCCKFRPGAWLDSRSRGFDNGWLPINRMNQSSLEQSPAQCESIERSNFILERRASQLSLTRKILQCRALHSDARSVASENARKLFYNKTGFTFEYDCPVSRVARYVDFLIVFNNYRVQIPRSLNCPRLIVYRETKSCGFYCLWIG